MRCEKKSVLVVYLAARVKDGNCLFIVEFDRKELRWMCQGYEVSNCNVFTFGSGKSDVASFFDYNMFEIFP